MNREVKKLSTKRIARFIAGRRPGGDHTNAGTPRWGPSRKYTG